MARKRTAAPSYNHADPFSPGVYLTDGTSLFNIVGELPHEPSLRLVEDCSTLEILMVHVDGLRAPGVRRIEADAVELLDDEEIGADAEQPALDDEHAHAARAHR